MSTSHLRTVGHGKSHKLRTTLASLAVLAIVIFTGVMILRYHRLDQSFRELAQINVQFQQELDKAVTTNQQLAMGLEQNSTALKQARRTLRQQTKRVALADAAIAFRKYRQNYFIRLVAATVQLGWAKDGNCRAGFVQHGKRIVLLSAAHCMDNFHGVIPYRGYSIRDHGTSQLMDQTHYSDKRHLAVDPKVDLARINLSPDLAKYAKQRALSIAANTPQPNTLAILLHWSRDRGRSLVVVSGPVGQIYEKRQHLYDVTGGSFGGVSGSLAINAKGEAIGVASAANGTGTALVGPNTIRSFLNRHP